MTKVETEFLNADEAFRHLYTMISRHGTKFADTKALFNIGFTIMHPQHRIITDPKRKWKLEYAEAEWQWYLSGDRNTKKLGELYGKVPEIWKLMEDSQGNVNSNYGWQWKRNDQIGCVINMLKEYPETRQAAISIYDCKEWDSYEYDTPCTYAVQFTILNNKLNMSVVMRSNDLWYGFCNDQYQFSKLQHYVLDRLGKDIEIGTYFHFAHNLHLYNDKI